MLLRATNTHTHHTHTRTHTHTHTHTHTSAQEHGILRNYACTWFKTIDLE